MQFFEAKHLFKTTKKYDAIYYCDSLGIIALWNMLPVYEQK